jgi:RNA polymerase sigma factor (sigma-70 family)
MSAATEYVWHALDSQRGNFESIARRHGMSAEEARDVVSEVIFRLVQRSDLDMAKVVGLAVTAVRGASVDELRRKRRERRALARMAVPENYDPPEVNSCSVAFVRSLLEYSAGLLTKAEMRVLCLVVDGEPHSVIAERLGITVRASEVALSRARRKLRGAVPSGPGLRETLQWAG